MKTVKIIAQIIWSIALVAFFVMVIIHWNDPKWILGEASFNYCLIILCILGGLPLLKILLIKD